MKATYAGLELPIYPMTRRAARLELLIFCWHSRRSH